MAQTFLVSECLTRLRRLADIETVEGRTTGDYSDDRFPDAILIEFLSNSRRVAYEELADADEGWKSTRFVFNNGGSGSYPLPSNLYKPISIEASTGAGPNSWVPIPRANKYDDEASSNCGSSVPIGYRIVGDSIELLPVSGSATVRLTYVPEAGVLVSGSDIVEGECNLDQLTVYGAWRLVNLSLKTETAEVDALYRETRDRAVRSLKRRDRNAPRQMRDPRDASRRDRW